MKRGRRAEARPFMPLKCAWCQEIRDERGQWRKSGIWDPGEAIFSHGICPRCLRRESAELRKESTS